MSAQEREALQQAAACVELARKYFPKSIHHADRYTLELTAAAIGKALHVSGTSLSDDKHADRVSDGREAINDMLEAQGKV